MSLFLLALLWSAVWLLYLNNLPPYRRQNPCRLPPSGPIQRGLLWGLPLLGIPASYLYNGVDGLFMWGFIAPLTGTLIGCGLPLLRLTLKQDQRLKK